MRGKDSYIIQNNPNNCTPGELGRCAAHLVDAQNRSDEVGCEANAHYYIGPSDDVSGRAGSRAPSVY